MYGCTGKTGSSGDQARPKRASESACGGHPTKFDLMDLLADWQRQSANGGARFVQAMGASAVIRISEGDLQPELAIQAMTVALEADLGPKAAIEGDVALHPDVGAEVELNGQAPHVGMEGNVAGLR